MPGIRHLLNFEATVLTRQIIKDHLDDEEYEWIESHKIRGRLSVSSNTKFDDKFQIIYLFFTEVSSQVNKQDRLRIDGILYEIISTPINISGMKNPHHKEIMLKNVST